MGYDFFLMPFFISFAIVAVLLTVFIWLNKKRTFCETRKSQRHIHHLGISRFGGVALIIAFIATILLDGRLVITPALLAVLVALLAILIFGFLDDIKQLSWKIQLFFQVAIVAFVYIKGVRLDYISNPFGGIFLFHNYGGFIVGIIVVVIWTVLLINSMNWIDGIDGISSGISLIGGATIFFLSLRPEVNQPPIGIISTVFMGGLLAFLLFNFHPAKIIAGTSGSMFMGFVLAVLAIFSAQKSLPLF
jgi:UDP-GlcNAc:undecaprenyl-phosphate GlcNAc-1-phosphate transferase